jgi:hypothetical protein
MPPSFNYSDGSQAKIHQYIFPISKRALLIQTSEFITAEQVIFLTQFGAGIFGLCPVVRIHQPRLSTGLDWM